ncbi:hypothetical protein FACS189427_03490 [Planctomycetales bacterium]|nr:hypothetical protein FACS189427_03490 [Planctomycetales bacterium]
MTLQRFSTVVIFFAAVLLIAFASVFCSEFCYQNHWGDAAEIGCTFHTAIGPDGFPCYSAHHTGPGTCAYTMNSNQIRIGTFGGVSTGLSDFVIGEDVCFNYLECGPSTPYFWGDGFVWDCEVKTSIPDAGRWSAQHASGSPCP